MEAVSFIGNQQQPGFNQLTKAPAIAEPYSYLSSGLTHATKFFSNSNPADSYAGPDSGDDYSPVLDEHALPSYLDSPDWEDILMTQPWLDSEGPEEIIAKSKLPGIEEVWCVNDLVLDSIPLDRDSVPLDNDSVPHDHDSVLLKPHYVPLDPDSVLLKSHYVPLDPDSVPLVHDCVTLEPHYVPLDPDHVPLEPHYVPLEPHDVPLDPDSVPLGLDSVPLVHDYVTLKPHYVTLEPHYVTLEPDYIALKPDSVALDPDYVALERDYVPPDLSRSLTRSRWPSYRISHPTAASLRPEVPVAKDIRFKGFSKKKGKYGCEIRISKRIQQEKKSTIKKVWLGTFVTQVQASRALDVGKYFFKTGTHKNYFDPRIETLLCTPRQQLQAEPLDALVLAVQNIAKHYGHHGTLP